jgi:hypothetical protein
VEDENMEQTRRQEETHKGHGDDKGRDQDGRTLEGTVKAPGFIEAKEFSFAKNLTVAQAAHQAAEAFGYTPNTPGFQDSDGNELPGDKRLVAAGVRDGDELQLIDTAGGV